VRRYRGNPRFSTQGQGEGSLEYTEALVLPTEGVPYMPNKSPKKGANTKTAASKSLKEKRADKKAKASKRTGE
jgi:hypothetical protein